MNTRVPIYFPQSNTNTLSRSVQKDKTWIPDICEIFTPDFRVLKFVKDYCDINENLDPDNIYDNLALLQGIVNNSIGLIDLNSDLDIETVTEIFIRINSQGSVLNQSDFAMSKIAADETYGGSQLIDAENFLCRS